MLGFNAGLLGVRRTPTAEVATGLWFQNEQSVARRAGIWIVGGLSTRYIRFANFADTALNSNTIDLAEIRFYNVDTVQTGITCTTNFSSGSWSASTLVNGDLTDRAYYSSWSSSQASATMDFDFGSTKLITHIQIYIHYENSSGPRFPATFDLQVSSDGTTYATALPITKGTCTMEADPVFKTAKLPVG
jgi:hypothetical protein